MITLEEQENDVKDRSYDLGVRLMRENLLTLSSVMLFQMWLIILMETFCLCSSMGKRPSITALAGLLK